MIHEYFFDVETVRLAVIVGVLLSMLFYERIQLTTGGAIVPGYLALFLPQPLFIVITLITAYMVYFFVNRIMAKKRILYGRRKFEIEIITALVLVSAWTLLAQAFIDPSPFVAALYGVGFVIPGIIAHDMFRQKPLKTTIAILITTGIVGLFIYVFHALISISPGYRPEAVGAFDLNRFGFPPEHLLAAVIVSVGVGIVIFSKLNLRTGGFVTGAYIALVLLQPLDVVFAFTVALLTFVFVTRFLMHHMMLFGRRKLSMMVLVGAIFAWAAEITIRTLTDGEVVPWRGFHVITLMIPALIANDAQRQGLGPTLLGTAISGCAVFTIMNFGEALLLFLNG